MCSMREIVCVCIYILYECNHDSNTYNINWKIDQQTCLKIWNIRARCVTDFIANLNWLNYTYEHHICQQTWKCIRTTQSAASHSYSLHTYPMMLYDVYVILIPNNFWLLIIFYLPKKKKKIYFFIFIWQVLLILLFLIIMTRLFFFSF